MIVIEQLMHLLEDQTRKLSQFRRHRDWGAAFEITRNRYPELSITLEDGRRAWPDANMPKLFDLADEEFIEQIIRTEVRTKQASNFLLFFTTSFVVTSVAIAAATMDVNLRRQWSRVL